MKYISAYLMLAFALSLSGSALAAEQDFEKHKQEAMANLDERIQKLNELKGCVSAAADKDALKVCHEKMKEWRHAEHAEHMEKRKGRIDERIKKLEQKKSEVDKKTSN